MGKGHLTSLQLIGLSAGVILVGLAALAASPIGVGRGDPLVSQSQIENDYPQVDRFLRLGDRFRQRHANQEKVVNDSTQLSININGIDRTYYLFSSSTSRRSTAPLLIMLHGGGGSAFSSMKVTNLGELGRSAGVDVIFPEGSNLGHPSRWNTGLQTGSKIDNIDDVAFLDKLTQKYASGGRPIFLGGLSNGGMMALKQLCSGNSRYAGAFIVAGGTSQAILDSCKPKASLPILLIHGRADSVVPFKGGLVVRGGRNETNTQSTTPLVSHEQLVSFWRKRNKCNSQISNAAQLLSLNSNSLVMVQNYYQPLGTCRQTLSVIMNDGDHGWPIDVAQLSRREKAQLRMRQRIAGNLVGKDALNPGSLDTSGIVIKLINRWSTKM